MQGLWVGSLISAAQTHDLVLRVAVPVISVNAVAS